MRQLEGCSDGRWYNISDPFEVSAGVLQSGVLVPFLLVTLVEYLLKRAASDLYSGVVTHPRCSTRYPLEVLNDLDFANDVAQSESTVPQAQAQLTSAAEAAKDLDLMVSVPGIECVTVGCHPHPALQVCGESSAMWQVSDALPLEWHLLWVTLGGVGYWASVGVPGSVCESGVVLHCLHGCPLWLWVLSDVSWHRKWGQRLCDFLLWNCAQHGVVLRAPWYIPWLTPGLLATVFQVTG